MRRMDKAPLTGIDADVIHAVLAQMGMCAEEHHVAWQQGIPRYRTRRASLLIGGTRYIQPRALVHISNESAAIEALSAGASEMIGCSDQLSGRVRDCCTSIGASLSCRWEAATAGEHGNHEK